MNKSQLQEAIKRFDSNIKSYKTQFAPAEELRQDFVSRFPLSRIRKLELEEYVQGKGIKNDNFCYEIERKLGALGSIVGASAKKFGIYYSKKHKSYQINNVWKRNTPEISMAALREALYELINAAKNDDLEAIRESLFSPMFKGKILSTYFPDKYLSIFSEEHLDYFIHRLDLDHFLSPEADIFEKRDVLVRFKKSKPMMKNWSLHAFSHFLYTEYPKAPSKGDEKPDFLDGIDFIEGDFRSFEDGESFVKTGKVDYEKQSKAKIALGERGEYVALQYETKKLKLLKIKKAPVQVSLDNDALGYDIQSYDKLGNTIYLEVKATNSSPKDFHFYFSANELRAALEWRELYHVYIVFKPNSSRPKIFDIGNPFIENGKVSLIPVTYKLHLHKV